MDNLNDLKFKLEKQDGELRLYKTKLRDLVIAHQGLIKEKKALQISLQALQKLEAKSPKPTGAEENVEDADIESVNSSLEEDVTLQRKVSELVTLIATLSEEKARIEERLTFDKKELLKEKETLETRCQQLENAVRSSKDKSNEAKAFLRKEKHDRDEEINSLHVMIKELENMVADERNSKVQLKCELENSRMKLKESERKLAGNIEDLTKLKTVLSNLESEYQSEIHNEKKRVQGMEEQTRKLSALQEERVVMLETRLAELSDTVGTYDRLRQQDQSEIQKLKNHLALVDQSSVEAVQRTSNELLDVKVIDTEAEVHELQLRLVKALEKTGKSIDLKRMLPESWGDSVHESCVDEYNKLKKEFELFKSELKVKNLNITHDSSRKEVTSLQNQLKSIQERIKLMSEQSKEVEKEYKFQVEQLKKAMKNEKMRFKETLSASETDFRGRLNLLEQQLHKQRERSLALLEEKEQELHSLQSTFQMFLPDYRRSTELEEDQAPKQETVQGLTQKKEGPHMLHYANELARRDVEIANLRKNKHKVEIALRDLQKAAAADTEMHREERQTLREEIARLNRCQTREGANLEYLKNVVLSFLLSNDPNSKRHMCNAISAVLKFSETEMDSVMRHSRNSWWNRTGYL